MKLYFSQLAQKELQDAVYYYDEIAKELGSSLLNEVSEAGTLLVKFPLAWSKIGKNQRRYLLKRFPYMLIYKVYAD
ncbi:MAG: type II toxin-antitoxin system RelE/ParE family toxin, partial [Colwellia sp.]